MRSCFQTVGMSVYGHGLDVRAWYLDLRGFLLSGIPPGRTWRLPGWISSEAVHARLSSYDDSIIGSYQVFHDCGKPVCVTLDADGRRHFPNHAAVSKKRWLECTDGSQWSLNVAELIGMDLDIHLLRHDGVEEFAKRSQAIALLITGLCEVHSNSQMFGGIDSVGFKIKWKHIDRVGKKIVGMM